MDKATLKALIIAKGQELGLDQSMVEQMLNAKPQLSTKDQLDIANSQALLNSRVQDQQYQVEDRNTKKKANDLDLQIKQEQLKKAQTPAGDADVKKQQNKLKTLAASLKVLEQNLSQVESRGVGSGNLGLLLGSLTGGAMYGETADYEALRKSLIGPVARAISGEVGVLTDRDISRAEALLPKVTDAPDLAERKLRNINQLVVEQGGQSFRENKDVKTSQTNTGNPVTDSIKNNPIVNFLLGGATNIAQDVGTGIRSMSSQGYLDKTEQTAQALEKQAMQTEDMNQRAMLLKQANQVRDAIGKETQDISRSFSEDVNANPLLRALGGATEIAATAEIPAMVGGAKNIVKTIAQPFKAVGNMRAKEIAKVAEETIDGDKLIQGLEKVRPKVPSTERAAFEKALEGAKQAYTGQKIKIGDAVELNKYLNDAFTASGTVGKSAKALVEKSLGDVVKSEIRQVAPNVAKANKLFELLYGSKKLAKSLVKPVAAGATTAYLLNKLGVGGR